MPTHGSAKTRLGLGGTHHELHHVRNSTLKSQELTANPSSPHDDGGISPTHTRLDVAAPHLGSLLDVALSTRVRVGLHQQPAAHLLRLSPRILGVQTALQHRRSTSCCRLPREHNSRLSSVEASPSAFPFHSLFPPQNSVPYQGGSND